MLTKLGDHLVETSGAEDGDGQKVIFSVVGERLDGADTGTLEAMLDVGGEVECFDGSPAG
jgi:hypothetical protein